MVEWINLEMMILGLSSTIQLLKYLICLVTLYANTHIPQIFHSPGKSKHRLPSVAVPWTSLGNSNSLRHSANGIKVVS